jgi:hypothetical protein
MACTYRRLPVAQTPADLDADMRAWLRDHGREHSCDGDHIHIGAIVVAAIKSYAPHAARILAAAVLNRSAAVLVRGAG